MSYKTNTDAKKVCELQSRVIILRGSLTLSDPFSHYYIRINPLSSFNLVYFFCQSKDQHPSCSLSQRSCLSSCKPACIASGRLTLHLTCGTTIYPELCVQGAQHTLELNLCECMPEKVLVVPCMTSGQCCVFNAPQALALEIKKSLP